MLCYARLISRSFVEHDKNIEFMKHVIYLLAGATLMFTACGEDAGDRELGFTPALRALRERLLLDDVADLPSDRRQHLHLGPQKGER